MKIATTLLAAGVAAASLSACAAVESLERSPEYAKLDQVRAGLTEDQVRQIAGRPDVATIKDAKGDLWIYEARNEFGELAEYDIEFDGAGHVRAVTSYDDN